MEGSLYWLVFRALAAIWLVRLACRALAPPGLGEEQGPGGGTGPVTLRLELGTSEGCEGGQRGDPGGGFLQQNNSQN